MPSGRRLPTSRIVLALGLAGIASAGLGTSVIGAGAKVRTFDLALKDGTHVTVSVDVAEDADPWTIEYPGVALDQIDAITETDTPAPVVIPPPAETSTTSAPAPSGDATSSTGTPTAQDDPAPAAEEAPATPAEPASPAAQDNAGGDQGAGRPDAAPQDDPPAAGGDEPGYEPAARGKGAKQRTTGKKPAKDATAKDDEAADDTGNAKRTKRKRDRDADATGGEQAPPPITDPTISISTPGAAPIGVPNFFIDKFRIPPFLLPIYQAAGIEYGVRWEVLAAINEIETDYGRNLNVSSAGAVGWMQFMPATWKRYGIDANGDSRRDPYNPVDAIFSAARYLKAAGADTDLERAVFAYNHADWYVDSVLMRARLIGGLPSNLIGSLTGLTDGQFPVDAPARYADELSARAASTRVAKGRNAAVPVEPRTSRRGINIYAKAGSPVIAVQDGKVVKMGRSDRLGKYVQLRDAYGNTYTYAHLSSLSKSHLQARGRWSTKTRAEVHAFTPTNSTVTKERLFANPDRPAALKSGSRLQAVKLATAADLRALDLPAGDLVARKLRTGSRVIGGTVLGRVGGTTPHVRFAIRPAGRGAPLIDPKPILDGWKLLESTATYRALGRNPFVGGNAGPTIGQILLMGKAELEGRVLRNPRVELYSCGREDVKAGRIDRRVLATLEFLAASGLRPSVTSLECGHSTYTKSGNVSEHSTGTAVDIGKINGIPVLGHQGEGSITDVTVRRLLTLQGTMKPHQIITLMTYEGTDNTLAMGDHDDHVHVGFQPMYGANSATGRQLSAVLKPGQWIKLIDRLGELSEPSVPASPQTAWVAPARSSARHKGD